MGMSIVCEPISVSVFRGFSGWKPSLACRRPVTSSVPCVGKKLQFQSSRLELQSRIGIRAVPTTRKFGGSNNHKEKSAIICQGGACSSQAMDAESSLPGRGASNLAPLAALALAFSKAATFMISLREEISERREESERAFCEAAEKNLPWRPQMMRALVRSGGISMALLSTTALAKDRLSPVITTLRANPTFMSGLIAWVLAQVMKVFTYYAVVRKWDFRMVMGSGGMPSSHSALCFALTTSVALVHGVADGLFPVCLGFTLIVMYDAAGVRRHAGKQAEILNIIVADMFQGHPISERKLKELLGHTPLQVFAGAALGTLVGYLCSQPT